MTETTGSYTKEQKIYTISCVINSASRIQFSAIESMQNFISKVTDDFLANETIKGCIGSDWERVWGPIIYCENPTSVPVHADNTMGVFYSDSQKLFVVAIAGTNRLSMFDWSEENLAVGELVPWKHVTDKKLPILGSISKGTHTGLTTLLGLKDENQDLMFDSLKSYIEEKEISEAEVAVTGASLGGALAPALALYMLEKRSEWDTTGSISVSTYALAGPTCGGDKFAEYYESKIQKGEITYVSKYNSLDVVPKAWNKETLGTIPTIYASHIKSPDDANPQETVMGTLVTGLALKALPIKLAGIPWKNPYRHIEPRDELTGTFDTETDDNVKKKLEQIHRVLPESLKGYSNYFINLVRFVAQVGSQHGLQYVNLLGIKDALLKYKEIVDENKPEDVIIHEEIDLAVKEVTGIDLSTIDPEAMAKAGDSASD